MKKGHFTSELKALTNEAATCGISVEDIKDTVWISFERWKQGERSAQYKNGNNKRQRGHLTKNKNKKHKKGWLETIRQKMSVTTVPAALIAIVCLAKFASFVVESGFSWQTIAENIKSEQCLVDSTDVFTEVVRPMKNCSTCIGLKQVDTVRSITQEEFREKYAYTDVPLLVKGGAKRWSAMHVYNFNYFKSLYKETPGAFEAVDKNCMFFNYRTTMVDLQEVMNMTDARARLDKGEETWYIGWCDTESATEKELKKHYHRPPYLPDTAHGEDQGIDWIFMGWPGPGAHIHIDLVTSPSWQAMVSGTKTWMLYPSVECEDVCLPLNVTLEAGDILTVDTNKWFHSTYIHPGNISISIGSEY